MPIMMILKMCSTLLLSWGCILCVITIDFTSANSTELMEKSLPLYAIAVNSHILNDSSVCRSELHILKEGIDSRVLWSLMVLDTSGVPKPGFIRANNYWLGLKTQCLDIGNRRPLDIAPGLAKNHSKYHNANEEFPPFEVNYFVARARHYARIQYTLDRPFEDTITLGLCLPKLCTNEEVSQVLSKIFEERTLMVGDLYSMNLSLVTVKILDNNFEWLYNWRSITVGTILIIILFMIVLGTGYDLAFHQKRLQKFNNFKDGSDSEEQYKPNTIERIFLSFSAYSNSKLIFDTKSSAENIAAINGIRSISLVLTFIEHLVVFSENFIDNRFRVIRLTEGFIMQIVSNGSLYVDSFFVISGFLISWSHFKRREKLKESKNISSKFQWDLLFKRIFKRIIRLTPVYMLIIGIAWMYYSWISKISILEVYERPQEYCAINWWQNLLYINNFFEFERMCLPWSWYLSNDMQYFIIGQFLLLLSDIFFSLAATLVCGIIIASMILLGYISYINEYIYTLDDFGRKLNIIYTPLWVRINPYLVGMITAYFLVQLKGKLDIKKKTLCALWIIGLLCLFCALFGATDKKISFMTAAIYVACSRTIWAIGIAWILVACYTNHAGSINTFLSSKIWVPLSRLTLSSYLLNPIVIHSIFLFAEFPPHVDLAPYIAMALGCVLLTFFFGYIMSIIVEVPILLFFINVLGVS